MCAIQVLPSQGVGWPTQRPALESRVEMRHAAIRIVLGLLSVD
jgi:hypothetical protein